MPAAWTGEGWDFAPTYDAADFGWYNEGAGGTGDSYQEGTRTWGLVNRGDGLAWNGASMTSPNYQLIANIDPTKSNQHRLGGYGDSTYSEINPDYDPNYTPDGFGIRLKTGEKAGQTIQYARQGDKWVPQGEFGRPQYWDTNPGKQNLDLLKVALTAVGGAFMGPALEGAGAAISAGSMPTVSQMGTIASMANTASGGQIPGLNLVGAAAGGYGALGNLASGSGGYMDAIKAAMAAQKLYGGYQNLTQDPSNPSGGGGRVPGMVGGANSQMPGQAGGGSGMGWLDQLFNMGGAMYSANKNDNYADELRQERARSLAERQPFLDRVGQLSGDAGAEQFRGGGTWQAAERVAANNFTRKDAQRGNLANDTDRTRLLQDHFMKSLESERGAARADLNSFDEKASRDAFMKGLEMDRMKNSPLFAGAAYGQGGGAGTLAGMSPQVIDMLKQIPGGFQYLQGLFGSGGATSPMPSVPSGVAFDGDYSGATSPYDGAGPGFDYSDDYSSWFGDDYFGGSGVEF
jgi:hypothetical protein